MAELVGNARRLYIVRVEFHPIGEPHRELGFARVGIPASGPWVPRPDLVLVKRIEIALQSTRRHVPHVAFDVAIDVMRMVLVLDER